MPFKLGSNDVSKLYLGSNEITKAYLGSNVIIEPTAGLPSLAKHTGYYDSGQSTFFTDETGNGYNGVFNPTGGGGTSSVTHVTGGTPYWQFSTPSSTSEQAVVDTGFNLGFMSAATQWTWWVVWRTAQSLSIGQHHWRAVDSGTDAWGMGTNRSSRRLFQNIRNGSQSNLAGSTLLSTSQWYMSMLVADGTHYRLYLNNTLEDTNTTPIDMDISIVLSIGATYLSSTAQNNFDWAAGGWMINNSLNATERTDLYNYYDAIYSF